MLSLFLDLVDDMFVLLIKRVHFLLVFDVVKHVLVGLVLERLSVFAGYLELHFGGNRLHGQQIATLICQPISLTGNLFQIRLLLQEQFVHNVLFTVIVIVFVSYELLLE